MAKQKNEEIKNAGSIAEAFKVLENLNPSAASLNDNSLSSVHDWIDTGSYALNAIISGSLYGGVPM